MIRERIAKLKREAFHRPSLHAVIAEQVPV
jgi:hypothetical protein